MESFAQDLLSQASEIINILPSEKKQAAQQAEPRAKHLLLIIAMTLSGTLWYRQCDDGAVMLR